MALLLQVSVLENTNLNKNVYYPHKLYFIIDYNDLSFHYSEQLYEIRKSSMSRLICDNAHDIDEIQPLAFELASEK